MSAAAAEATHVDVLVVGLGPAGARAAAVAARQGLRVVAVDRRRAAGIPVQCAEFVPAMIGVEVQALAHSIRQPITAMATFIDADPPQITRPFPGHMLDRAAFDAALAADAAAAGADCRFGTSVRRVAADGSATLADGTRVVASVIVGADGPRSIVGRAMGRVNTALVETRQVTVPLLRKHDATDIFLSRSIPGGYGWLFPKGARANLGAGVAPAHRSKLKAIVETLHAEQTKAGRVGAAVLATTGGAIPVGGMLQAHGMLGDTQVLLAGDAAGLANPVTGAGIAAAVFSGGLAGAAAGAFLGGPGSAAEDYDDELRSVLGASLARAACRRRELAGELARGVGAPALRRGWIAFPEYWAS